MEGGSTWGIMGSGLDHPYPPEHLSLMNKMAQSGGVITPFSKIRPQVADAQIHESILWTKRPHFPGSIFYTRKNYHPGDFNLFYVNVRENARLRAKVFLENHRAEKP